jgi:chorismate synthase
MSARNRNLILRERGNTLTIKERKGSALVTLMQVTAGAVTKAQLMYYEANLKGRIKQIEADLILKYFYGLE